MRRKSPRQLVCRAIGIASAGLMSALLSASAANSQGLGIDSLGTLGSLLDELQGLQSSGVRNINAPSPLDRAREKARQSEGVADDGSPKLGISNLAGDQVQLMLEDFCAGTSDKSEQELQVVASQFSRLEADFCLRSKQVLRQYGYELFDDVSGVDDLAVGSVTDDYLLGVGDELVVSFHGQQPSTITTVVDREGRVILPNMQPLSAVNRTFGQFRRELRARTASRMLGTEVFVSLANVRLLSVVVVGEVQFPGVKKLTGLSNVIDALNQAGGIKKTGSLRKVQVRRGNEIFWVDLYDLMFGTGASHQLGVNDGDRIIVPSIGSTVAVAGDVKRPGIYELAEGQKSADKNEVLEFAGGTLRPRGNRIVQITFEESGNELVVEHKPEGEVVIRDGDILKLSRRLDIQTGTVELLGHVRVSGLRTLAEVKTVRGLVPSPSVFLDNPYLPFAVLETTDPETRSRRFFPVNLRKVMAGELDFTLREFDRLIVLGAEDVRYLSSPDVQEIIFSSETTGLFPSTKELDEADTQDDLTSSDESGASRILADITGIAGRGARGRLPEQQDLERLEAEERLREEEREPEKPACNGLTRLIEIVRGTRSGRYANAVRLVDQNAEDSKLSARLPCPPIFDQFGDLLPFALEHVVAVNGEVRRPGAYPLAGDTALGSIVAVAGGLTLEVDLTRLEISRFDPDSYKGLSETSRSLVDLNKLPIEKISVSPGDVIRFNPVFTDRDDGPVILLGEFVRPGIYEIRRGETLSEVIRRGGGLTEQAYPYGAIFLRERVREVEQQGFLRASRELNSALAVAAVRRGVDPRALLTLQEISERLGKVQAIGRVVIEADPTVLQVRRELDTVLEPGDRIFVPKRPNFVSVLGDVLNPGAQQFLPGTKGDEYIRQAGGFQRSADEDRVFIVFPNGRAQPLSLSAWNYSPVQIPPGSTIVVPKDPVPFDLLTFTREITDLVSKVALTAASLRVLSD